MKQFSVWVISVVCIVGKRHFDDPNLIEKIFQRVDWQ